MNKIGDVIHYYDKISVAVLKLADSLKVGDKIKFLRGGEDLFEEVVESMQIEHKPVTQAQAGDEPAIKVGQKVREGAEVFRVE